MLQDLPQNFHQIKDFINYKSIKSSSVPGLVSGVIKMHEAKGSIPLNECLKPAIIAASEGVPLSEDQSYSLKIESEMNRFDSSMKIWGKNNKLKTFGEKIINEDLAKTLSLIANNGSDAFYNGKIAERIVNYSNSKGGYITKKDLENFNAEIVEPISTNYRGYKVYESPPNSSGVTLLQQLNIIENFDPSVLKPGSYTAIHAMAEAKRLAFYDREKYLADPKYVDIPVDKLLSKDYAFRNLKE